MAIDKHALIARVKELEGLTNDEKSQIIGFIKTKTYGLVWEDSTEKCWEQLKEYIPVLLENKKRAIISDKPEAPNHILIEGDNLLALTNLCATHQGKIDVIYIDPPYNTGNKDFVYNDSYVDSEDAFRHSKWLSFMSKRLRIAKRLLSDRGVIFISIDENEVAPLRLLGDEIFLSKNFVGQWNWFKSATPPALSKKVKRTIEYVLCWQVSTNEDTFRGVQKVSKSNDPFTKPQNTFKVLTFPPNSITCAITNGIIPAGTYGTDKFPNELLDDIIVVNGKNSNTVRFNNRFIWVQSTLDDNISQGLYIELSKKGVLSYKRGQYNREVPPNLIDDKVGVDTTENAGRMLLEIFDNQKLFDYPKPISLIKYLVNFIDCSNLIILDFFAGSGTTMHAVMQLNAEDGGHRQCILVTNNENGICENVTYERNKRVINGYTKPNGEWVEGLHDNNLRYYKVGFVPRDKDLRFVTSFAISSVNTLCIKHGVYAEQPQFGSLQCTAKRLRYFDDGVRRFLVILDPELVGDVIAQLQQAEYDGRMPVYVFTTGNYPYTDDFGQVSDRVELYPYPTCIYGACEQEMPRTVDKPLDMPDDIELTDDEANMTYDDLNKE